MVTEELADLARRARILLVAAGDFAAAAGVLHKHLGDLDPTTHAADDDLVVAATVYAKALAATPHPGCDGAALRWAHNAYTAGRRAYGRGPTAEPTIIAGLEMALCQFHTGCCALAAGTVTRILTTWQQQHPRPGPIDAMLLHPAAMAHRCGRHHAARAHRRQADAPSSGRVPSTPGS
jgi:hypothetical protein